MCHPRYSDVTMTAPATMKSKQLTGGHTAHNVSWLTQQVTSMEGVMEAPRRNKSEFDVNRYVAPQPV